jgi:hypothetical protein
LFGIRRYLQRLTEKINWNKYKKTYTLVLHAFLLPLVLKMQTTRTIHRQDTLPVDDPSWSRPQLLPGQARPIPPRNEEPIYIPYGVVDGDKTPRAKRRPELSQELTELMGERAESQPEVRVFP